MSLIRAVYTVHNTLNDKVYVGSSSDVVYRLKRHESALRRGKHANVHLQSAWDKYGEDAFTFSIIEKVLNADDLLGCEQRWMDSLQACDRTKGYNIALHAGAPMRGRTASAETRTKLSLAGAGRKLSVETKQKISKAMKSKQNCLGRKLSDSHRAALSESNRKRTLSAESREKIRVALTGTSPSEETRKKMRVVSARRRRNLNGTFAS